MDESKISSEVSAKYSIANNAFKLTEVKNAEVDLYTLEPKDEIKIIVGDDKQIDKVYPQVKLERWSNEVNFSIRLVDTEVGEEKVSTKNDKILWEKGNIIIENYPYIDEADGGYKFVWYLKAKPNTNKFDFTIQSKGLDFFYQPPMTEEHLETGQTADKNHIYDSDGKIVSWRPDNIVGSYAVYHQTKGVINDENGKDYKNGQAFLIYCPHIIDANGKETWGRLHIENGVYSVEIPQEFLDTAVYPIKSNDTFGYTSAGGSYEYTSANRLYGSLFTPTANGTVTGISTYGTSFSGTANFKGAIVLQSNLNFITNGISNVAGQPYNTYQWVQATFGTNPTITASTGYNLSFVSSTSNLVIMYTTGDANQGLYDSSNNYTTPTNPTDGSRNTKKYSIYATYTAGAPSTNSNFLMFMR